MSQNIEQKPSEEDEGAWQCTKCLEDLEETFDVCWNCGTTRDGQKDPEFDRVSGLESDRIAQRAAEKKKNPIYCLRCERKLEYFGTRKFHEGTRAWGFVLGDIGELLVNRESFDVYACSQCGKVEFFVDGWEE